MSEPTSLRSLFPGRHDLATVRRNPGRDLLAGLTVAVVALPLALGFGVASGMGAAAGLATAIVAGALAAVFGGSNYQVSGPTGAMTVVLVPIVARYGPEAVLLVGFLAGLILVVLAALRSGRFARYIPAPVVEGFTLGIAVVIFLQQVPSALGVAMPDGERILPVVRAAITEYAGAPDWPSITLAASVAAVMLIGARVKPKIPYSLIAVAAASVIAAWTGLDTALLGELPATLPVPGLGFLDITAVPTLVGAALAVAVLAALESLLSATVADGMTVGDKHDPDRELMGQGIANLAAPLFGGVPATAAIARTAVNVRSGASSRLAALVHAAALAVIMLAAAPLVAYIPLSALAGVLMATALRMVEVGSVKVLVRASRSDALILVLTAGVTVVFDLIAAVVAGLVLAGAMALGTIARHANVESEPIDAGDHRVEGRLLEEHIAAYRIDGPLFFAAAHRFLLTLTEVADVRVVIIRLSRVSAVDATGALVLRDAVERLEGRGIEVYLSGVRPHLHRSLQAVGLLDRLEARGAVFETTPEAIAAAHRALRIEEAGADGSPPPDLPGSTADSASSER